MFTALQHMMPTFNDPGVEVAELPCPHLKLPTVELFTLNQFYWKPRQLMISIDFSVKCRALWLFMGM